MSEKNTAAEQNTAAEPSKRAVRAFDIRTIIGTLLGLYGIVTFIMGFTVSDAELDTDAGMNINLITGIALIIVSAFFLLWVRFRPLVVPDHDTAEPDASEAHIE